MERVEGAVAIYICEAVPSSVRQKLNAVRDELMAGDNFNIFRVPAHVRQSDRHLHEPLMVAIGPYGRREEPSLQAMEHHKLRYLHDFLSRRNTTFEDCIAKIQEEEPRARRCYCDPVQLSAEKFAEILLFDGCFIIELLTKLCEDFNGGVRVARCSSPFIVNDLLLLENQIPLFVLEKLFKIGGTTAATPVEMPERPSLTELLVNFLTTVTVVGLGEEIESSIEEVEGNKNLIVPGEAKDFNHLLHFYYHCYVTEPQTAPTGCTNCGTILKYYLNLCRIFTLLLSYVRSKICGSNTTRLRSTIPSDTDLLEVGVTIKKNQNQNQNQNHLSSFVDVTKPQTEPTGGTIYGTILKRLNPSRIFALLLFFVRSKTCKSNKKRFPGTIPSATELLEAGVTIKKKKNPNLNLNQNRPSSFLDVTFCPRHGVLEIPFLSVDNSTLPLFSNLVALEQCGGCNLEGDYMSSYAAFMDCLINTPEDEAILRQRGILENNLASDKHLLLFFNQLSEWLILDFQNHYLAQLFGDVGEYCGSPWHKWRAKLMRDYFSNPWAIISLIAALVVLIFTFLQTFYSIYTYYHPS